MLSRAPFVGIVLLFMAGILCGDFLADLTADWLLHGILLITAASCLLCYQFKSSKLFTAAFWLFLIVSGAFCRITAEQKKDQQIAYLAQADYRAYEATVTSLPEKRDKMVRLEANVTRILAHGQWSGIHTKVLLNLPANAAEIPQPGDVLVVNGRLELPAPALNPEQFDYRKYLRNKGILWTGQLWEGTFQSVKKPIDHWSPRYWLAATSEWADLKFRENIVDNASYGLVKAMLLGRRDDLQAGQTDDYVASGTVHILSVSGMHVAIIFLAISAMLGWLKRWPIGKLLYVGIMILLLCFYAMVTGFSPSVQRATIMCIVFVLAEVSGRKQHSMNTLAISALLILLFDNAALFDVGFQLSYLAMSGIFLFYEPIYRIFTPKSRVLGFAWQVTALAFAAQLATFPLSLYYFHQFPTYFWLVNPFVIAFTNVLLPAALVLLLVSATGMFWLQWLANQVVEFSAYLTNVAAGIPKHFPGYLVEQVNLGAIEVVMLYCILFLIWYAYENRAYHSLKYSFALVFLLTSFSVSKSIQLHLSGERISYVIPKHSAGSYRHGNVLYVVSDNAFRSDQRAFDFYVKNYAVSREVSEVVFVKSK
ncbi:ComEC/Rec2 family competence protein [Dyadobacter sp. Leaf189]|uniref:ComEC/Rec2 family competence protein n=1 Tax=Dyadobacter sp. Leaf189 TaxID=1736295 RepID=UPI0006F2045C|nr:ComEC/Rec2 family competence protein [Dyadobacter sp. Leaf189]KQS28215.1 competence protein ComEC [Dyadobacter sp. Leaf189]